MPDQTGAIPPETGQPTPTTAERFRELGAKADSIAAELTRMRERLALTSNVDSRALSGAIEDANGCRTWCEFLERRAREAGDPR